MTLLRRAASLLTVLAATVCVAPAGATAEGVATDGTHVLTLRATPSSPSPGTRARPRRLGLRLQVDIARIDGGRPLGFTAITFDLPRGARLDPRAVPQCRERKLARGGAVDTTRCPAGSRIGSGVAYADARPVLADRIAADVELINGLAETDAAGRRFHRPQPAIFLVATALDIQVLIPGLIRHEGGRIDVPLGDAASTPEPFTITGLDLRIHRAGRPRRPYLRAPTACDGQWVFSVAYQFASPLVARDAVPCAVTPR
jgi:hypothetical protein